MHDVIHDGDIDIHVLYVQVILLADILPSLLVKLTAPFYIHLLSYRWPFTHLLRSGNHFYMRKQLLLSARLSHRNFVCPSVSLSVCHTGGSGKNSPS